MSSDRLRGRGVEGVEFPFLVSCAVWLLDRRYWILGLRRAWKGTRFDVVAQHPSKEAGVVLVEGKYRSDRPVRPHEVREFAEQLETLRLGEPGTEFLGLFMTNSGYSRTALEAAEEHGVRTVSNVPVLFKLR